MRTIVLVLAYLCVIRPSAVAQALENGDFERGPGVGWTTWSQPAGIGLIGTGAFFQSSEIDPPVIPRSGQWMGRVGGFSYAQTVLGRVLDLPDVRPLHLGFWYQTRTANGSECAGIWVGAQIRIAIAGQVLTDFYMCRYNDVYGWTYGYYDVSAVAGQRVELVIRADAASSIWSFLYVDDVHLSTPTGVAPDHDLPTRPELDVFAPFPNPATDRTSFRIDLTHAGRVRLSLHDVLGRQVRAPVDGDLPEGTSSMTADLSGLPPGLYVARVTAFGISRALRVAKAG